MPLLINYLAHRVREALGAHAVEHHLGHRDLPLKRLGVALGIHHAGKQLPLLRRDLLIQRLGLGLRGRLRRLRLMRRHFRRDCQMCRQRGGAVNRRGRLVCRPRLLRTQAQRYDGGKDDEQRAQRYVPGQHGLYPHVIHHSLPPVLSRVFHVGRLSGCPLSSHGRRSALPPVPASRGSQYPRSAPASPPAP